MVADEAETVHGHIGILLLEQELLEDRLNASNLKPQNARVLLSQLDTLHFKYMSLAGKLQGLSSLVSRKEYFLVVKQILAAQSKATSLVPVSLSSGGGSNCAAAGSGVSQIQAKLPQINLPLFSGGTNAWICWSASSVQQSTAAETLRRTPNSYLLTSVSGEALCLISESEATGASYTMVMQQLCDRYEDRTSIFRYYLRRFLNSGHASEDGSFLRKLLDRIHGAGNLLMAHGYMRTELFNTVGSYILLEHLPPFVCASWDLFEREDFDFSKLCRFVENCTRKAPTAPPIPPDAAAIPASVVVKPTLHSRLLALSWRNKDAPQRNKPHIFAIDACGYCIGCGITADHPLHQCPDYQKLDAMQRLCLVCTHGRCVNSCTGQHNQECRFPSCLVCRRRHHTLHHEAPHGAMAHAVFSIIASKLVDNSVVAPPTNLYYAPFDHGALLDKSEPVSVLRQGTCQIRHPTPRNPTLCWSQPSLLGCGMGIGSHPY